MTAHLARRPVRRALPLVALSLAATLLVGSAHADSTTPADPTLAGDLDAILSDARLANAQAGVVVLDAATGQPVYQRQPNALLTPASTLKTVTTAAALDLLGADHRFTTEVRTTGTQRGSALFGDLVLRGGGDPSLRPDDLDALAAKVADAGITVVTGRLLTDATRYESTPLGPGWAWDDEPYSYSPQISALTLAPDAEYTMGAAQVIVTPGEAGKPAKITFNPAETPLTVSGQVTTGAAGSGTTSGVERKRGANVLAVSGSIAAGAAPATYWTTVENPAAYTGAVFAGALARHGVRVVQPTAAANGSEQSQVLASHDSATIGELITPMLKLSNNGIAEHLLKETGKVKGGTGSWSAGITQVRAFLKANGLELPAGRQVDGSGLSRYDLVTPAKMAGLMQLASTKPWFDAWYAALPVAGNSARMVGGTLTARMRGTAAQDNVHAKSGSMGGVDNLTGYATAPDGRKLVFTVMVNNFAGTSPRPLIDAIAVRLAAGHPAAPSTAPAAPKQLQAPQSRSVAPQQSDDAPSAQTRWEDCELLARC
ncbi:D-alanyl-D-alanine carboxypeptidase/D-alanyl-D-alanine-endopeptidase [Kitasatospora sp. NPDC048365]|uniref:D-alanyl-D-alanine carboxypeptidase/D-alanyl-D-alanine endopeptidase n=1 Tax=Kitasatospora sp. NPDC048365 TaxID=3364050 RepID=UPI0037159A9B